MSNGVSLFSDHWFVVGVAGLLICGLFLVIYLTRRIPKATLDKEFYQAEWLKITNTCQANDQNSLVMAVINGDKLLDKAMIELGFSGKTMGERLKNSPKKFSNLDGIWRAHKLRNRLVHETGAELNRQTASQALTDFKLALKDLGAI